MEHEVYRGYLLLPVSGKLLLKKSWHQKYCYLYKASKSGIERLEIWDSCDNQKGSPSKIITLENCIKIQSIGETSFTLTTKTSHCPYEFNALTSEDKNKWLNFLQSVAFPDDVSSTTCLEEDNDLYCSSGEGVFTVKIHPSTVSNRCGLDHTIPYILLLTNTAMKLKSTLDGVLLYTWPYCFIRRYGCKSGKFTFEAGRKCDSGEGTFYLEHPNQQEIFRCLASKMKSMKKLLKEDSSDQLQAAMSMEARSRSPLPLSIHDIEPSADGLTNPSKVKPAKPPRKNPPQKPLTYEVIDKYDRVEYRSAAWKTMGLNEVNHEETLSPTTSPESDTYFSWGDHKLAGAASASTKAPKILRQESCDDDYDKLNFFGSNNKLNVGGGYKQVAVGSVTSVASPPSFNDYDEVQPGLGEVRPADDSHLGYAMVRKTNPKEGVNHHFHNDQPYAVISKPKRV